METYNLATSIPFRFSINCTLRNGNVEDEERVDIINLVLIVPCGMETRFALLGDKIAWCINCTLRNGNDKKYLEVRRLRVVLIVPCGMETKFFGLKFG